MPDDTLTAAEINGRPSHDDLRMLIRRALTGGVDLYGPGAPYVVDVSDTDCVVERSGQHWRYPYTVNEVRDQVTLGTPVPTRLNWQDALAAPIQAGEGEQGTRAFVTDLRGLTFSETDVGPVEIEVCRDGTWQHSEWGEIKITPETRASFIANYEADVRGCGHLPLDYDHEPGPAPGWITGLKNKGASLFATVDLTPSGRKKIEDREYCFFSPEWHPNWRHPATGEKHGPTLFGGGLTNRPFFRGMAAINCAETSSLKSGDVTGATPQRETRMGEPTQTPGVQGNETPADTITAAEVRQMRERLLAVELQNAALRAAEERRSVEASLGAMRFSEGRTVLAPACRESLTDALMDLPGDKRQKVVDAVKGLQFAELGERGFSPVDETDNVTLTASEEAGLKQMADTHGLKFDEVKAVYIDNKKKRQKPA